MYEQIRRVQPKANNKRLWLALAACGAVLLAIMALVIFGFRYKANFRDFLSELSNSTNYALENNSLYLTVDGDTFLVIRKNIKKFYNAIAIAGSGRPASGLEREADIKLDFGNGAVLELWETQVKNARNNRGIGMIVRFTNAEGNVYCYDTDRLRPEKFPLKKPTIS